MCPNAKIPCRVCMSCQVCHKQPEKTRHVDPRFVGTLSFLDDSSLEAGYSHNFFGLIYRDYQIVVRCSQVNHNRIHCNRILWRLPYMLTIIDCFHDLLITGCLSQSKTAQPLNMVHILGVKVTHQATLHFTGPVHSCAIIFNSTASIQPCSHFAALNFSCTFLCHFSPTRYSFTLEASKIPCPRTQHRNNVPILRLKI